MMRPTCLLIAGCFALALPLSGIPAGAAVPEQPRSRASERAPVRAASRAPTVAETLRARIDLAFTVLSDDLNFSRAADEFQNIFDQALAYAHDDAGLIRDAAFALRFARQLGQAESSLHRQLFDLLRQNDELARTLVFLVKPGDDTAKVYDILSRLHAGNPRGVASLPALAAAICVVHDRPRAVQSAPKDKPRHVNPVALFDYFTRNAGELMYPPRTTAAELLVYIVDTTADVDELRWAFSRHAGDRMVQKRYNDLNYDTAHLKYNKPKKIDEHPYTLENLRRHGGVCEEQAYYATHVARAIGVPAVYISGRGAGVGHAWVGVAQPRAGGPAWYMEEGRHDEFRQLRGSVTEPQTSRRVPDDHVALSGPLSRLPIGQRHAAAAYIDGAERIWSLAATQSGRTWPPEPPLEEGAPPPRQADNAFGMALLERAANAAPPMPEVWLTLAEAARAGRLARADRMRWFDAFYSAVGADHPDFCFNILSEMIPAVEEPAEQATAWDWIVGRYHRRLDLCAEAMLGRARGWRAAGDQHQAYLSYIEVVNRYGNEARAAVTALREAERLLAEGEREGHILELYRQAFQRIKRPSGASPQFYRSTNYYAIGNRYATLLEAAGQHGDADRIRRLIASGVPKD